MELPERAASVWREIEPLISRARAELPSERQRLSVGGGTVLAARWGHRLSHDIDLFVDRETEANALVAPWSDWAGAEIERIGGRLEARGPSPDRHLRVSFPNHPKLKECGVDITRLEAEPPGREKAGTIGTTEVLVLDTAQILRGKLERAERSLVRDVFDVATAARLDPGALSIAANCCTHQYIEVVAAMWHLGRKTLAEDARRNLDGVEPRYAIVPEELAANGAAALRDALYERVEAYQVRGGVGIIATTRRGWRNEFTLRGERLEAGIRGTGIGKYLQAAPAERAQLRKRIRDAARQAAGDLGDPKVPPAGRLGAGARQGSGEDARRKYERW